MFGRSKPLRFTICQEQRLNLYLINNLFVIISLKNSDAKSTLYQRQININVHTYDPLSNLINTHTHRDLYELLSFSSLSKPKKKKNKKKTESIICSKAMRRAIVRVGDTPPYKTLRITALFVRSRTAERVHFAGDSVTSRNT